jgi:glycosyltransferase involved in cell wall biosynthesis
MDVTIFIFFILSLYSLLLYPFLLILINFIRGEEYSGCSKKSKKSRIISIIITVYNGERYVIEKLSNVLKLKRSFFEMEVFIISDGSTDNTDQLAQKFIDKNVHFIRSPHRMGKGHCQSLALKQAKGDVVVFTDISVRTSSSALVKLLRYFDDPKVGAVSSADKYIYSKRMNFLLWEELYLKYEMWLRLLETKCAGLIGMSGSLCAARRCVTDNMCNETCSDFWLAINARRLGYKCVQASNVWGCYPSVVNNNENLTRRIRTIHRGMKGLWFNRDMLNIARYGMFSFQLASHKLMRWLTPVFFIIFSVLLFSRIDYDFSWTFLIAFSFLIMTFCVSYTRQMIIFILHSGLSIGAALIQLALGKKIDFWNPSVREKLD